MGREWYFTWGRKSPTKKVGGVKGGDRGGGGGRGGSENKSVRPQVAAAAAASGGCMNTVLHMFDFHHLHLCLHPQNSSYLPDDPTPTKGVEAPRNSLDEYINIQEKHNYSLNTPMDIQIKTNRRDTRLKLVQAPRSKVEDTLSENSCSPATGTRTPTLVARLMGLDILPESKNNTPRSSSSSTTTLYSHISTHTPHVTSTKTRKKSSFNNSLPESPRSSSSSSQKRSRNVVDKHRLSLQIDKENNIVKEMESSRPSCSAINTKRREGRKYEEENKSPGYCARQIMKQVKETVSRRVGADITNTIGQRELRKDDENLLSAKTPTNSNKSRLKKSSENNSHKVLEKLRALDVSICDVQEDVPTMDKLQVKPKSEQHYCTNKLDMGLKNVGVVGAKSCSRMPPKYYESIRNKKDEQFVRPQTRANNSAIEKKCKMSLSSDLVHGSVPSIVPLNKDSISPQAHPKLLQEQGLPKAQLTKLVNNISPTINTPTWSSRSPSQRTYEKMREEATHKPADHEKKKHNATTSTSIAEFQYISRILKCTGIDRDTPISFTKWFSPSHPLDSTIYHSLENTHYFTPTDTDHYSPSDIHLSLSINRKLIFHVVDEILADILKPNHQYHINGLQLVKTLCTRIRSFPSSNCQTLQDIDALVEKDMSRFGTVSNLAMFEEEGEAIVTEIEHEIVDSLVHEIAVFCLSCSSISMQMIC